MKKTALYLAIIAMPFLFSCNQGNNSGQSEATVKADSLAIKECFVAIDGKDTADLSFKTLTDGKIAGHLTINYNEKGKNDGEIEGKFHGDTLFVDYTFKIGNENKTIYKNPLALLKKDGKLFLGVGQIQTTLGRSFFVKDKPIDFEKGRFTFAATDCKEK